MMTYGTATPDSILQKVGEIFTDASLGAHPEDPNEVIIRTDCFWLNDGNIVGDMDESFLIEVDD